MQSSGTRRFGDPAVYVGTVLDAAYLPFGRARVGLAEGHLHPYRGKIRSFLTAAARLLVPGVDGRRSAEGWADRRSDAPQAGRGDQEQRDARGPVDASTRPRALHPRAVVRHPGSRGRAGATGYQHRRTQRRDPRRGVARARPVPTRPRRRARVSPAHPDRRTRLAGRGLQWRLRPAAALGRNTGAQPRSTRHPAGGRRGWPA